MRPHPSSNSWRRQEFPLAAIEERRTSCLVLREENRKLRNALGVLVREAFARGEDAVAEKVQAIVLDHSKPQIDRERAFVAGANFDVFPDDLPTLDEALARSD